MRARELERKKDEATICGKDRGMHAYIPVATQITKTAEHVVELLCTRCMKRINLQAMQELFSIEPQEN